MRVYLVGTSVVQQSAGLLGPNYPTYSSEDLKQNSFPSKGSKVQIYLSFDAASEASAGMGKQTKMTSGTCPVFTVDLNKQVDLSLVDISHTIDGTETIIRAEFPNSKRLQTVEFQSATKDCVIV